MPEIENIALSKDQISAVSKAIFINWLLNYAKAYPEKFPEKEGLVIHQTLGDPAAIIPALSRDEILSWHSKNRADSPMTVEEFGAIMVIQKRNGLVIIGDQYYTIVF